MHQCLMHNTLNKIIKHPPSAVHVLSQYAGFVWCCTSHGLLYKTVMSLVMLSFHSRRSYSIIDLPCDLTKVKSSKVERKEHVKLNKFINKWN